MEERKNKKRKIGSLSIASKTKKKERLYFNSKIIFEVNKKTTFLYGKYKFIFSDYIQIGP